VLGVVRRVDAVEKGRRPQLEDEGLGIALAGE